MPCIALSIDTNLKKNTPDDKPIIRYTRFTKLVIAIRGELKRWRDDRDFPRGAGVGLLDDDLNSLRGSLPVSANERISNTVTNRSQIQVFCSRFFMRGRGGVEGRASD